MKNGLIGWSLCVCAVSNVFKNVNQNIGDN